VLVAIYSGNTYNTFETINMKCVCIVIQNNGRSEIKRWRCSTLFSMCIIIWNALLSGKKKYSECLVESNRYHIGARNRKFTTDRVIQKPKHNKKTKLFRIARCIIILSVPKSSRRVQGIIIFFPRWRVLEWRETRHHFISAVWDLDSRAVIVRIWQAALSNNNICVRKPIADMTHWHENFYIFVWVHVGARVRSRKNIYILL